MISCRMAAGIWEHMQDEILRRRGHASMVKVNSTAWKCELLLHTNGHAG